ncbi:MAG: hypothetical protein CMJ64_29535 [Planctomycetaceae bacterium]|nr:hypothetical protein [Planctomycetaceae bacterium]
MSYYIRGQDLRFSLSVIHFNGAPLNSEDGNFRAGDDGVLVLAQLQWLFWPSRYWIAQPTAR